MDGTPGWRCCLLDAFESTAGSSSATTSPTASTTATDYTIPVHGERRGLPHVLIEIRQDLLTTAAECAGWASRLASAYRRSEPSLLS